MNRILLASSFVFLLACNSPDSDHENQEKEAKPAQWKPAKVEDGKINFENQPSMQIGIYDIKYIDQISIDEKAPFFIMSGRDCKNCDHEIGLYIHSPRNGTLETDSGKNKYQYPRIERNRITDSLIYSSRTFYGEVLPGVRGLVWYETAVSDNGKLVKMVYISEIIKGKLEDRRKEDLGQLQNTLELMKEGKCREIPQRELVSE